MSNKDKIKEILEQTFQIEKLIVEDDSHKHAGHAEAPASGGSHFSVFLVSPDFEGLPLVKRHRLVYDALKSVSVHALALKTITPSEQE